MDQGQKNILEHINICHILFDGGYFGVIIYQKKKYIKQTSLGSSAAVSDSVGISGP